MSDVSLLLPEWQGYGIDSAVAAGARAVAGLFDRTTFVEIDAPDEEVLIVDDGVLGLASIAARLPRALAALNERHPSRLFTIGGTCGVELAPVSYLNAHYRGDLAVVWLDAHADLNTPESSPSGHFHGMLNLMLESLATFDEVITDAGTTRSRGLTLSPGFRTGWDIGEKQVVVGFAAPTLWRDGEIVTGAFAYFSYELPFRIRYP